MLDMTKVMAKTGKMIKIQMIKNDCAAAWMAEKMNVSVQTVYRWIRGDHMPDLVSLCRMADLFGCSLDELVGR